MRRKVDGTLKKNPKDEAAKPDWWFLVDRDAKRNACDKCKECKYFLDDYWQCQGREEACHRFKPGGF